MILADKKNDAQLMALIPSIRNHLTEWQIVNFNVEKNSPLSHEEIIAKLLKNYKEYEGMIYPVSDAKIVMIARLGVIDNYSTMKTEIESSLPNHCCRILLRKLSQLGLKQLQIDLSAKKNDIAFDENLFYEREERRENVVLIADDDAFIRKSSKTLLPEDYKVFEVAKGDEVLPAYLECNPDIVLLDIHMPDKTGLELIPEIISADSDAFIIVLSADSMKENVVLALEEGARGFLTKPPNKKKFFEYLSQCITIR